LNRTAKQLSSDPCQIVLSYERIAVSLGHEPPTVARVREFRFNAALQARVHELLGRVRSGEVDVAAALGQLLQLELNSPRHSRWLVAMLLGAASASLARLLGGDGGASLIAAVAAGVGFLARRELGHRGFGILALPFVAALIGAVFGGIAIRWGWTNFPALALIVPSLILVPGTHIINGLLDLVDNYVPLGLSRLTLAASILIAAALGVTVGIELTLGEIPAAQNGVGPPPNVLTDMLLAGVVTCGFALAYNTEWSRVVLAVVGGMLGHGLRYVALQWGCSLGAATFLGGFTVGVISACIARTTKSPFAVVAFAGAVTMMPGVQIYRALGGALKLARLNDAANSSLVGDIISQGFQACVVMGGLALGLVVGSRTVALLVRQRD
jgi:uncharacterized membrane protein YjjP (DUF1212 family)